MSKNKCIYCQQYKNENERLLSRKVKYWNGFYEDIEMQYYHKACERQTQKLENILNSLNKRIIEFVINKI